MNFIGGEVAASHGAATIGIRPEHLVVSKDSGDWEGRVGVAEHLGSDTFIHIHDTGLVETLTVRVDGEVDLNHGDVVKVSMRPEMVHLFDQNGERI